MKRCLDSPAYFYNTYVKLVDKQGNEIPKKPVTDEEIRQAREAYLRYKYSRR